jgi:hypothetical protein
LARRSGICRQLLRASAFKQVWRRWSFSRWKPNNSAFMPGNAGRRHRQGARIPSINIVHANGWEGLARLYGPRVRHCTAWTCAFC